MVNPSHKSRPYDWHAVRSVSFVLTDYGIPLVHVVHLWRSFATILERPMIYYSVVFFIIAIVAAAFGFGNISAGATDIAKVLFFLFIVLFILSAVFGFSRRGGRGA